MLFSLSYNTFSLLTHQVTLHLLDVSTSCIETIIPVLLMQILGVTYQKAEIAVVRLK